VLPSERERGKSALSAFSKCKRETLSASVSARAIPQCDALKGPAREKAFSLQPSASAMRSAFCKQAREFLQQCTLLPSSFPQYASSELCREGDQRSSARANPSMQGEVPAFLFVPQARLSSMQRDQRLFSSMHSWAFCLSLCLKGLHSSKGLHKCLWHSSLCLLQQEKGAKCLFPQSA